MHAGCSNCVGGWPARSRLVTSLLLALVMISNEGIYSQFTAQYAYMCTVHLLNSSVIAGAMGSELINNSLMYNTVYTTCNL